MEKILLIEDDENLGHSLKTYLSKESFEVEWVTNLMQASMVGPKAGNPKYDLLILDWMLPDGQGVDYLKTLRAEGHHGPIILLTAKSDLVDKVLGLESGANDYMTKPFEPRELLARIRVQIRNHQKAGADKMAKPAEKVELNGITIDLFQHKVEFEGKTVDMTKMEYELLKLFLQNPNRAFSREEILNKVWGYENYPTTRTVDTHVLQLRQKFHDEMIETIRGVGYRLKPLS